MMLFYGDSLCRCSLFCMIVVVIARSLIHACRCSYPFQRYSVVIHGCEMSWKLPVWFSYAITIHTLQKLHGIVQPGKPLSRLKQPVCFYSELTNCWLSYAISKMYYTQPLVCLQPYRVTTDSVVKTSHFL